MLPYSNVDAVGVGGEKSMHLTKTNVLKNVCIFSVILAFSVGLVIGLIIPFVYLGKEGGNGTNVDNSSSAAIKRIFLNNSYGYKNYKNSSFPAVSFVENSGDEEKDSLIEKGIYWGRKVEKVLPEGYRIKKHNLWSDYIKKAEAVKMEFGCGRMQNRLVTFKDGVKGCVRYRQNTDQIQGELFSFYLARILQLPNLAPSTISIVDLQMPLWQKLRNEIASAQWNSNRPIVFTQFISNLETSNIPQIFKPLERHLNKQDVLNMTKNELLDEHDLMKNLIELAQWSDLIIFDYLTANLDRIVNNLYNYQWNANIMDAPAHNLAKKSNTDLLIFLDNESGLLHGYRLLKKYEIYHSILLENLCLFRKTTANIIKQLKIRGNVGDLLKKMFESENSALIKDILPTIPEKSVKILNDRIDRVYEQIIKCQNIFGRT